MSPKKLAIGTLALFAISVVALSVGGKGFLRQLQQEDVTVGYIDLARQATQKREYNQASQYYDKAVDSAKAVDPRSGTLSVALDAYSKFLQIKRNPLKDVNRAEQLEKQAVAASSYAR
jgi:hypothetical protein